MFPKGAVAATAPLSGRLAHLKRQGHVGRLLDLPHMAGMGHFLLPCWERGHQHWEHTLSGTPQPWGLSSHIMLW